MDQKKPMSLQNADLAIRELPYGLVHKVERLSLGFEWASPLSGHLMAKLSALGDKVSSLLPRKLEVSTSDADPDSLGGMREKTSELFAIMFDDNKDQDGPVDVKHTEIIINNEGLYFTVYARYDGWEITRALALRLCGVFLEAISQETTLAAIEIRVSNIFGLTNFQKSLSDLLDEECASLPRRIFSATGFWHVDEGYFEHHSDPDMSNLLVNLNVSKMLERDAESLYIKTLHRFEFKEDSTDSLQLDRLFEKFEHLHAINKKLLASVLNQCISDSLRLFPEHKGGV